MADLISGNFENPLKLNIQSGLYSIDADIIEKNFSIAKAEGKRHYCGASCSWHGYGLKPWCPKCGGMMTPMPESAFWSSVIALDAMLKKQGAWIDICKWTIDKCFPNFETMLQVYNSLRGTKYKPQDFTPF